MDSFSGASDEGLNKSFSALSTIDPRLLSMDTNMFDNEPAVGQNGASNDMPVGIDFDSEDLFGDPAEPTAFDFTSGPTSVSFDLIKPPCPI